MRLVAFLQLYNEYERGNLERCLINCAQWADDIFIYDDCSTDGSQDIYLNYTEKKNIIFGTTRNFKRELFHKQELLELVVKTDPNWIGFIDGDTVLCKELTENCKDIIADTAGGVHGGLRLHNMNFWRHPAYYRIDSQFDLCRHIVFWLNSGALQFDLVEKLHQPQFPLNVEEITVNLPETMRLLHYGFASDDNIIRKYLMYKSLGEQGLTRLIDDGPQRKLIKVPKELYPIENIPLDYDTCVEPLRRSFVEVDVFNNYQEYINSK